MTFCAGDRVYYVSGRHPLSRSNPLKGSKYECIGIVKTLPSKGPYHISAVVNWDNGTSNIYSESDLELVEKQLHSTNPNVLFHKRNVQ